MTLLWELLKVLIAVAVIFFGYYKWSYTYWSRRNIPTITPVFPFGNTVNPMRRKEPIYIMLRNLYDEFKRKGAKHGGLYVLTRPLYMAIDPEVVKNILSRDFGNFVDRGVYYNEKDDPLSAHLFSIDGEKWRQLRTKLTPTFTSGKMKTMFPTLVACGEQMKEFIDGVVERGEPLDIKETFACFTTDVIGSCAFGLDCNCFKDPDADFRKYGKKIFSIPRTSAAKMFLGFIIPPLARLLKFKAIDDSVSKFFSNAVKSTVEYRESNNFTRNDFMQLLIGLKNTNNGLTMDEISAQAFVFFIAGFETSSTVMTYCLFELAQNDGMQERVRKEILEVLGKHDGEITYESVSEMKYLSQLVDETLRKYPSLPMLNRRCTKDYKVPDTDLVIEKGTNINIPIYGFHHDPENFPDPEKFDPERFSDENKDNITPYTYLPFGEGPRNCIGMRFGLMQAKVGLVTILKNYRPKLNEKTVLPLAYDPYSFTFNTLGSIWMNVEKI